MMSKTNFQDKTLHNGEASEEFFREINIEFLIHELKDPIAVIEAGVRTLLEKTEKFGALTPRQEKVLKRIRRNSNKARDMLHGLLEVGRSEAGCFVCCRFQPVKSAFGVITETLDTLAGDIAERFRAIPEEKSAVEFLAEHGIFFGFSPRLETAEMVQDETKFRQIVGNLIKNALSHRSQRVDVWMECDDANLNVDISDDGPGIDPAHHQLIFERYKQVKECALEPRSGHGLGLTGSLVMARSLGGDIELESQKGKGATFRLRIPLKFEDTEE